MAGPAVGGHGRGLGHGGGEEALQAAGRRVGHHGQAQPAQAAPSGLAGQTGPWPS